MTLLITDFADVTQACGLWVQLVSDGLLAVLQLVQHARQHHPAWQKCQQPAQQQLHAAAGQLQDTPLQCVLEDFDHDKETQQPVNLEPAPAPVRRIIAALQVIGPAYDVTGFTLAQTHI